MEKLIELLNSLIEKGWNVFGHKDRMNAERCNYIKGNYYNFDNCGVSISLRELVSINSGLWQFVCENGIVKEEHKHERILDPTFGEGWADCKRQEHDGNYGYRLIESALKDESELEEFLLNSIKLD